MIPLDTRKPARNIVESWRSQVNGGYAPVIPITAMPGTTLSIDVGEAAAFTSVRNCDQSSALTSCVTNGCGFMSDGGGNTGNPCSRFSLKLNRAHGGNGICSSPCGAGRSNGDEVGPLGGLAYGPSASVPSASGSGETTLVEKDSPDAIDPRGLQGRWSMLDEREKVHARGGEDLIDAADPEGLGGRCCVLDEREQADAVRWTDGHALGCVELADVPRQAFRLPVEQAEACAVDGLAALEAPPPVDVERAREAAASLKDGSL